MRTRARELNVNPPVDRAARRGFNFKSTASKGKAASLMPTALLPPGEEAAVLDSPAKTPNGTLNPLSTYY
jgi:hypothetical protein